jgi:hypothetical protein
VSIFWKKKTSAAVENATHFAASDEPLKFSITSQVAFTIAFMLSEVFAGTASAS